MSTSTLRRFPHALALCLIGTLACALYFPFLRNPLVFDDWVFFSGSNFAYYATRPFDFFGVRNLPYFTLAFTFITSNGDLQAHRLLSLVLHLTCSVALYKLLYDLLRLTRPSGESATPAHEGQAVACALIGAGAFAIHPMAVYGAGSLVQRTIVFATLFSILSIILFTRGLVRSSHADAVSAALMYTLAVYSKEHSVLLPAVAVLVLPLTRASFRFSVRHAGLYLLACAPAAVMVTLLSKGVIGRAYEPDFGIIAMQIESMFGHSIADLSWSLSAVTQAGLFFKYLALWLWPDTGGMSIDLRVDFFEHWSAAWIVLKVGGFVGFGALAFLLLLRRGRLGLAGLGMLYVWVLFLPEFSVSRFQEPFVLYRRYLWAPGIMLAVAAPLTVLRLRWSLAAFTLTAAILIYQAHDRLATASSSLRLWQDAVAKLPAKPVPWGTRSLYMLTGEYMREAQVAKATEISERCLEQYPETAHCYYARGLIHYLLGQKELAVRYLSRVVELDPKSGIAFHRLGLAVEQLGRMEEAKALYRHASDLGFKGAGLEFDRLESASGKASRARR
jgi:protein O-mannosyl-transferase